MSIIGAARRASRNDASVDYAYAQLHRLAGEASRGAARRISNMVTPSRSNRPRARSASSRRSSDASMSRRSSLLSSQAGNSVTASSVRVPGVIRARRKSAKKVAFKKAKRVKVSRTFRAKVNKSLAPRTVHGYYEIINTEAYRNANDNVQNVYYLGNNSNTFIGYFDPLRVLDAASVLFNGKAAAILNPGFADAGNFNVTTKNMKIKVISSSVMLKIKNNTQRTRRLAIYEIANKQIQNTFDPIAHWTSILTDEVNKIQNIGGSMQITNVGASPNVHPSWKTFYKMSETKLTLEPGQSHEMFVNGPSDTVYDYSKFFNGTNFQLYTKNNRYFVCCDLEDLESSFTVSAIGGRYGQPVNDATHTNGVICEATQKFKIEMPEQTGFKTGAAFPVTTVVPLELRQDTYYFKNFTAAQGVGSEYRTDEVTGTNVTAPQ